jgi:transposase-like protein
MSTPETTPEVKPAVKSIRYTDAQKKEIVDFAVNFNSTNGRGGQSKAAEHFKVSQITVASWLKAAGAKKPGSKGSKAKKSGNATKGGTRYSPEEKQNVIDFVASYNAANGRGGQSKAAEKFSVSPLTIMAWLKGGAGSTTAPKKSAGAVSSKVTKGGFTARLDSLVALNKQIERAESELAGLHSKFAALKASL